MSKLLDSASGLMTPDQVAAGAACVAQGPDRARAGRYEPGDGRNDVEASPVIHLADRVSRLSRMTGQLRAPVAKVTLCPADIAAFNHPRCQEFLSRAGPGCRRSRCPRRGIPIRMLSVLEEDEVADTERVRCNER
jgi:hypothetical protein